MKAREVAVAVLASGLFYGMTTVWPVWAGLVVVIPFAGLLGLSDIGDWRERRRARLELPVPRLVPTAPVRAAR
jgi:hypothetical protein